MDPVEATREALLGEGAVLCVRLGEGAHLVPACRAAARGGLRALEITLTTPGALEAIAELSKEDVIVGGGTVLTPRDVRAVAAAGGRFAFSPVFDREVVDEAHGLGLLAVPGAATPAEILAAHRQGARLVKVFPSGALGGPDYVRAIRGPLPFVPLVPTSGPTAANLAGYLAAGAVAVGIGAEVFPRGAGPSEIEAAARRVRTSLDAARRNAADPSVPADARVDLSPIALPGGVAPGLSCTWQDGQYTAVVATKGIVGCGIFDPEACERFGFAVAMAHGTPERPLVEPVDLLRTRVDTVSTRARELGVEPGMSGAEALDKLL